MRYWIDKCFRFEKELVNYCFLGVRILIFIELGCVGEMFVVRLVWFVIWILGY